MCLFQLDGNCLELNAHYNDFLVLRIVLIITMIMDEEQIVLSVFSLFAQMAWKQCSIFRFSSCCAHIGNNFFFLQNWTTFKNCVQRSLRVDSSDSSQFLLYRNNFKTSIAELPSYNQQQRSHTKLYLLYRNNFEISSVLSSFHTTDTRLIGDKSFCTKNNFQPLLIEVPSFS